MPRSINADRIIKPYSDSVGMDDPVTTLLLTELVQWVSPGQVVSPPPLTVAVLVSVVPAAAAVGVTGIAKELTALAAKPAATVQVTTWPAAVQPAGMVPKVRLPGIVSVTVAAAVVAAMPVLVTVRV